MEAEKGERELISFIERRVRKAGPAEREEQWQAGARRYNTDRREEMRSLWYAYHQGQAARLRTVLEQLIASHEEQARLYEGTLNE